MLVKIIVDAPVIVKIILESYNPISLNIILSLAFILLYCYQRKFGI